MYILQLYVSAKLMKNKTDISVDFLSLFFVIV